MSVIYRYDFRYKEHIIRMMMSAFIAIASVTRLADYPYLNEVPNVVLPKMIKDPRIAYTRTDITRKLVRDILSVQPLPSSAAKIFQVRPKKRFKDYWYKFVQIFFVRRPTGLVRFEFAGVQPMSSPVGKIFTVKPRYSNEYNISNSNDGQSKDSMGGLPPDANAS